MTASTAPTQPPDKCPACNSAVKWKSGQRFLPNVRIDFECGYIWGYSHDDTWDEKQECSRAFSAAIALRAERDDLQAMYQRAWTEIGELRARVKELESDYAALEYLDHESSIGAAEVGRQVKELEAERDAALARAEKTEEQKKELHAELRRIYELLDRQVPERELFGEHGEEWRSTAIIKLMIQKANSLTARLAELQDQLSDAYKLLELSDIPHDGPAMRAALASGAESEVTK